MAHWATTEARFRKHLKNISEGETADLIHLDDMLICISQDDVVKRRVFDETTAPTSRLRRLHHC